MVARMDARGSGRKSGMLLPHSASLHAGYANPFLSLSRVNRHRADARWPRRAAEAVPLTTIVSHGIPIHPTPRSVPLSARVVGGRPGAGGCGRFCSITTLAPVARGGGGARAPHAPG